MRQLIAELKRRGLMGFAVIDQGRDGHYLAVSINRYGRTCDPCSWDTHSSPEEAVNQLAGQVLPAILPRDCDAGLASDPPGGVNLAAAAREPGRDAEGS